MKILNFYFGNVFKKIPFFVSVQTCVLNFSYKVSVGPGVEALTLCALIPTSIMANK